MARSQDQTIQLKVRMKEPLRSRLEVFAKRRGVSLNEEVVTRLMRSFDIADIEWTIRSAFSEAGLPMRRKTREPLMDWGPNVEVPEFGTVSLNDFFHIGGP